MIPETHYAVSDGIHIAYQVVGDGPVDLILVPGWVSNIEIFWEEPKVSRFLRGLANFSRLILFDKRGTGLSDRVTDTPTLEERMDDVRAVMDAVGSQRAALVGYSEGGPMCSLFAATYPERTVSLIMIGSYARRTRADDYPFGMDPVAREEFIRSLASNWPLDSLLGERAPSAQQDARFANWWTRFLRMSASPAAAAALTRANTEIDIRDVLATIQVPTLVLHARADRTINAEEGRYIADKVPNAQFVEIDSEDHLPWLVGTEQIIRSIEEFITGERPQAANDRILATIMFTDIVASTQLAAKHGDRIWGDLREAHNSLVRDELASFNGREINTTGDGFVMAFDGPARAVRCAENIRRAVAKIGVDIRAGIHTGECEFVAGEYSGLALHIAARIATLAPAGQTIVSRTVRDLVAGSGLTFEEFGVHRLKGVPDEWQLYRVIA
jgi:pimeloyl-ACP methyl ester carboxylesterase